MDRRYVKSNKSTTRRRIVAATYPEDIHPAFSTLDTEASRAGYELTVLGSSIEDVEFVLKPKASDDGLPIIDVWLDRSQLNSKNVVYYECTAKFPTLDSRNLGFYDQAEYYMKQWTKVARFMTFLLKEPVDLSMYED